MLLGIVIAAFNLRVAIAVVGPLIEEIRADTGMSSALAGVLTTIPFACMAVFSFLGIPLVARLGPARVIGWALAVLAAGTAMRAAMPTAVLVILATVPIGVGLALAGMALPAVVKEHFAGRAGAVTGSYVASLSLGGAIAAVAVVPVAEAIGGWRWAFAATAIPVLVALPLWRATAGIAEHEVAEPGGPARYRPSRTGLLLAAVFGTQSMTFSGTISWVAAIYVDAGWDPAHAALTTAAVPLFSVPAALVVPRLSDRGDRRLWVAGTAVVLTVPMIGLAAAPTLAPWLWAPLFGLGTGAMFPLVLTLPLDLRERPTEVADLSAWMLGIGYVLSALSPVLVGALRDATGGFGVAFGVLAVSGALSGVLVFGLRPRRSGPVTAAAP